MNDAQGTQAAQADTGKGGAEGAGTDDRSRWLALYVLCTGMLMVVLDATIVNVALPSIQDDLGFSQSGLAWVVNAYLIAFGGLLLLAGRVGEPAVGARLVLDLAGDELPGQPVDQRRARRVDDVLKAVDQRESTGVEELVLLLEAHREVRGGVEPLADAVQHRIVVHRRGMLAGASPVQPAPGVR